MIAVNRILRSMAFGMAVLLLVTSCAQEASPPAGTGNISAAELSERLENNSAPLILDVRSASEFADGHIPGAINIAHDQFTEKPDTAFAALSAGKSDEIVVHCVSGRRASAAVTALTAAGYGNVRHLEGDFQGWQAGAYPVTVPSP